MSKPVAFDHYTSSSRGISFQIFEENARRFPLIAEDQRTFDRSIYSQEVHPPVPVLSTGDLLQQELPRCLDMPIRMKGEASYYLPEEWLPLLPLLLEIAEIEHGSNPHVVEDYYTYLTVDCGPVRLEEQQRNGGLHVDGFQGARIQPKTKITRNYVATSNGGTRFYPQLFDASLDDRRYNIFKAFDQQAEEPLVAGENIVWFMDAYSVHESGFALRDGRRTFLRMTYDYKKFDRLGNTKNSLIPYQWNMVRRTVHEDLEDPPAAS